MRAGRVLRTRSPRQRGLLICSFSAPLRLLPPPGRTKGTAPHRQRRPLKSHVCSLKASSARGARASVLPGGDVRLNAPFLHQPDEKQPQVGVELGAQVDVYKRQVHVFPQPTLPGATPAPAFAADLLPRSPPASSPPLSFGSALQSKTSLSIVWGPMLVGGHLLRSRDARRSIFAVSFCVKVFSTLAQYAIIAAASLSRRGAPGLTRAGAGPCFARALSPASRKTPPRGLP